MTLRHLRIFISVYETGGTTNAAKQLNIAQPSVSLAISELEKSYGIRLFDRMSHRLYVTDTGRQFYSYAKHVTELFDEMERSMMSSEKIETIRIGSTITIGSFIIPRVIKQISDQSVNIKTQIRINKISVLEKALMSNNLDIALMESTTHEKALISAPFYNDYMSIICSPSDKYAGQKDVDIAVLKEKDFLFREEGSAGRELVDSLLNLNEIHLEKVWESVSPQAIINAVALDLGYSILPYALVENDLKTNRISQFTLKDTDLSRTFSIVYHKNKFVTKAMETFIDMLKSVVRNQITF